MNSQAIAAHERLLGQLAGRVRTHLAPASDGEPAKKARKRDWQDTKLLHGRIRALKKQGLTNVAVADQLGVTPTTVSKHLRGYIKSVKR